MLQTKKVLGDTLLNKTILLKNGIRIVSMLMQKAKQPEHDIQFDA